ncbi:aldo/keto reductase [Ponticaulis sp.]|uniref:aldo/keto reductase n=1 Tax=Ponticaulis sp. TaxID=2020902 RepID=UPI00262BF9C6|nr:aldo/keto reductase [Ponticaulis sp.]MDF1681214.1 aldo/keto reductase [Ponticaulis sp.]
MPFTSRSIAGKQLKPIGLGCMSLSQAYLPLPSEDDGVKLLNRAIDLGYDHLDTARLYGLGHNEALLSRVLKTRRDEVLLASKCGINVDGPSRVIDCKPETVKKAVDTSLSTLGVDYIDLYYLHRRDFNVPIEDSVGALVDMQAAGKIGAIGLSEMSADTLRQAASVTQIAAMQTEYSLWTRNPELGVLETCKQTGTAFVAFSPVARGALARAVSNPAKLLEKDLRKNHPRFTEEHWPKNQKLITAFEALAEETGVKPAQLSLYWVLSQGEHVHAIPGTGSIPHLEENFATLELSVSDDILGKAGKLINQGTVSGHRYPEAMRKTIDTEDYI